MHDLHKCSMGRMYKFVKNNSVIKIDIEEKYGMISKIVILHK